MWNLMNASLKALLNEQYKLVAELREENKNLKEKLSEITMVADDEKQSIEHILELEEENKKLKENIEKLEKSLKLSKWRENNLQDDLSKVEEIKDREWIKLRKRITELEQELKDEKVKNKLLRIKKKK